MIRPGIRFDRFDRFDRCLSLAFCKSLTDDELKSIADKIVVHEDVVDLCKVEDPLHDQMFNSILGHKGIEYMVDNRDKADEKDSEQAVVPEFIRDQMISFPSQVLTLIDNSRVPSSKH
jgi:hypothetical protein